MKYDFKAIEKKWQDKWESVNLYDTPFDISRPKYYALIEFPYPSAQGFHVGHARPYTAMDIVARKKRMEGFNVLFPMGWDAFGLPTENFAIKNKVHPAQVTKDNIDNFRRQAKEMGISFGWSREVDTTDPAYYKWTQWIFLQMFKRGLAYKREMAVNWCTSCKCVLANEEVVDGVCERCGSSVVRKFKSQWILKITEYAGKLLDGLDEVDFIDRVKVQTRNWIGRSHGVELDFKLAGTDEALRVYTTRPDTLFGATYMVISPEHEIIDRLKPRIKNFDEVSDYRLEASKKSDLERAELNKEKTGVRLDGVTAINPVTDKEIPVFISDYVLISYGTGAIMAVPAHDERDYEFAEKFDLPIVEVVAGGDISAAAYTDTDSGIMVNSGFLNGMAVDDAKTAMAKYLADKGIGVQKINYKLRDWIFSRQRYWGEPIPIINCPECGYVPLPESELPLLLPQVESYEPTDTGESPLAQMTDWVNCKCPECGADAKRETDTMPQWAGSSWYFLRYCDPHNNTELASSEALKYFMPVDWYNGGMEHTTLHMLYSRFWALFLYDIGVTPYREPYRKRTSHGYILGEDGVKMSKSLGNIVTPDEIIREFGSDTLRMYVMFIGDFEKTATWNQRAVKGCHRFLERTMGLLSIAKGNGITPALEVKFHRTIKKVTEDIADLKMNTAIAAMMTLINDIYDNGTLTVDELKTFVTLLYPFAPHVSEEMWEQLGGSDFLTNQKWVEYDPEKTMEDVIEIAVQISGKLKGVVNIPLNADKDAVIDTVKKDGKIGDMLKDANIVKEIYVPNKLVNIVIR